MNDSPLDPQIPIHVPESPTPAPPKERFTFPLWATAAIAIIIGLSALLAWRSLSQKKITQAIPTPTAVPTLTPTPIRQLSALASQSAFLSLESAVASLSSQVQNFQTEDPSLNPPVLDLPLGF